MYYDVRWIMLWTCVLIGFLVMACLLHLMFSHRRAKGENSAHFHENLGIEFAWTVIPLAILVAMTLPAMSSLIKAYEVREQEQIRLKTSVRESTQGEILSPALDLKDLIKPILGEIPTDLILLFIGGGSCDQKCEKTLLDIRMVNKLSSQNFETVQLLYMPDQDILDRETLEKQKATFPWIRIEPIDMSKFESAFAKDFDAFDLKDMRCFVVTPDNLAVLSYNLSHNTMGLLDDLARIFKH